MRNACPNWARSANKLRCIAKEYSVHPNQFHVDEAWIVFKLNDEPLRTDRDGLFNIICLMDAASCFILGKRLRFYRSIRTFDDGIR